MTRRTNQLAWGLLVLVLLVGAGTVSYGKQTGTFQLRWIGDWRYWWVGKTELRAMRGSHSYAAGDSYHLGPLELRVTPRRFPDSSTASPLAGTER
jgi:hypothetical protein